MDKVYLINKPYGYTSFDVVAKMRKLCGEKRIGHTGTLDINATGLLIVLCGKTTKYLPYCEHNHKFYEATIALGSDTLSKDIWGEVVNTSKIVGYTIDQLNQAVHQCIGVQDQYPPMVSSRKVNGRKLMDYAKNHETVDLKPKRIEVYDAVLINEDPITVRFEVSGGTYVRNLCEDIAHRLNNCGAMASLVRTRIGDLVLENAQSLDHFNADRSIDIADVLDPTIPVVNVDDPTAVYHGKTIALDHDASMVFIAHHGSIIAVYQRKDDGLYHCKRGLW